MPTKEDNLARPGLLLSVLTLITLACSALATPAVTTVVPAEPVIATIPSESPQQPDGLPELQNPALVNVYDPARNPAEDLTQAIAIAQTQKKRIMLELGGDWCIWCKYIDEFYATHSEILQYRVEHYILVKVNVSEENMNEAFLSQYPQVDGYPHIFILESDGTFLHSQNTAELEDGYESYVPDVFMAFLEKWALQ